MDADVVDRVIAEYQKKDLPPLITFPQAAKLAQVPIDTLYDWSSRGLLDSFKSKRGRRALLALTEFVRFIATNDAGITAN